MDIDLNNALSFEEIREGLKDKRLLVVAERTGVSYSTLQKFSEGTVKNCRLDVLMKISKYLKDGEV